MELALPSTLQAVTGLPFLLASGAGVPPDFPEKVAGFLTIYYLALALMNGLAAFYLWQSNRLVEWFRIPVLNIPFTNALACLAFATYCVYLAPWAGSGNADWMPSVPYWIRELVNQGTGPVVYSVGTLLALSIVYVFRGFFVKPTVAWTILNAALLAMGLSMTDFNFYRIVGKADNVPIVMLVFLLGFFTWLAASKAVENDRRAAEGLPPLEKEDNEKVLVWPDLVYTELVCMIAIMAFLIIWGILLQAPLEEPASIVKTPNPSKAPWYFLGLQEMLVYYDPWMAGVVLPSMIVMGLMALPYLDFNKAGNGYYTIASRKFAYLTFQLGFLVMWVTLIILGTFLRGPNWNFFGPFETWDPHKVQALNNINLSEYFWVLGLNRSLPRAASDADTFEQLVYILIREAPGLLLVLGYFVLLPPIMALTVMRRFFVRMGLIRFMTLATLLLFMASLPIKMVLRWVFNLKYLIAIPEYFLNF